MDSNNNKLLRQMPRVDILSSHVQNETGAANLSQHIILTACREVLDSLRHSVLSGEITQIPDITEISRQALKTAQLSCAYSLKPVINATGVVLHTNLGRAVLSQKVAENVKKIASSYSTLEYSVESGERGSRHTHIDSLLCALTGAEAAMAVNNNAAAVMLTLMSMCKGKEVVVSRGELVEIGGSFRVPEIMAMSGAVLKEVGTTNKTKPSDYIRAISKENTAALLKVHTSNFKIVGFSEQVDVGGLAAIGKEYDIPVIYDLGSGLMADNGDVGITDEVTVRDCIQNGADVVCFSGDKLFGGPQAGIIIGRKKYINIMKSSQFARVVRIDKLTLAALEATLKAYLDPQSALEEIPALASLAVKPEELRKKAERLYKILPPQKAYSAEVKAAEGQVGGGSAPGEILSSYVIEIISPSKSAQIIEKELREFDTPIIARINKGSVLIDVRTVSESEFCMIADAFEKIFAGGAA